MRENTGAVTGYRKRAVELRAEAEKMTSVETRKNMLSVAANYEQLADSLERMARESKG